MKTREFSLRSVVVSRIVTLSVLFIVFSIILFVAIGSLLSNSNKKNLEMLGKSYSMIISSNVDKAFSTISEDVITLENSSDNIESTAEILAESGTKAINIYKKNNGSYLLSFSSGEKPKNSVLSRKNSHLSELFGGGRKVYRYINNENIVINYFSKISADADNYIVNIRKSIPLPSYKSLSNYAILSKGDFFYLNKDNEVVNVSETQVLFGPSDISADIKKSLPHFNASVVFENNIFSSHFNTTVFWIIIGLIILYIIWFFTEISFLKFSTNPIFGLTSVFKKISEGDKAASFNRTNVKEFNIISEAADATVNALLNEQSKTEALLNRMPVPVAVFDTSYDFVYKNKNFLSLFHLPDNHSTKFLDVIPPSLKELENQIMAFVSSPKEKNKTEIYDPKNEEHYIVRFAKIHDNDGELSAVMVVFNDITFQKQETEKQINRSKRVENILMSIEEAVLQLSSSSAELTTTAESLSTMLAQQNTSVSETNTSIQEMNTSVENISSSVNQITKLTDKISSDSEYGVDIMENSVGMINNVKDKMTSLVTTINDLNTKTGRITKILKTVYDISEQTNLLALNASIEAVRNDSGSQSFKVIAEEIRELSDRTYTFTKEIEEGLDEVVNSGNSSVMIVEETEKMLNESYKEIDSSKSNFTQIKNGIVDINSSLHNINNILDDLNNASSDIYHTSNDLVQAMSDALTSSKETQQTAKDIDNVSKTLKETLKEIDKLKQ